MPTIVAKIDLHFYLNNTDKNHVKFILITLCIFVGSCGVNPLQTNSSTKNSAINSASVTSCLCTTDFSPVCGVDDKKSYENACLAKCFGNKSYSSGNCQCRSDLMVCGIDNQTYSECDAKKANVAVKKYVPCETTEI